MANEEMKEMLHGLLQDLEKQKADMSTLQQRLAAVTASATSSDDLVTAWVNTKGILIQLKFHPDAVDRAGGLSNLGRYITEATQKAAQQAQTQMDEIMAPMKARMDTLPQISEMFPGLPDLDDFVPEPVAPSTEPPDSPKRVASDVADPEEHYEELDETRPRGKGPLDQAW
ncbi:YbaB/EbfC family DNA-binding protein [Gordonia sp. SID5947]|uniref:YbaB/EbfC family nucleoid-associated protein n=1 Tax=Gordonia sp. SID5947 TaxID=2690315 RepID=UPI001371233F|nr:YbaB/EbfC family nucleoid-associated protein [Gordonia sp. SID5947]MYR07536.1 YbaB/EbfC family DNA-binding protein [Gordonia sp. SID5947]